jgi:hypothetical protein
MVELDVCHQVCGPNGVCLVDESTSTRVPAGTSDGVLDCVPLWTSIRRYRHCRESSLMWMAAPSRHRSGSICPVGVASVCTFHPRLPVQICRCRVSCRFVRFLFAIAMCCKIDVRSPLRLPGQACSVLASHTCTRCSRSPRWSDLL